MILKNITLDTPAENVLYDEVLLRSAEKGQQGEALRFWEPRDIFVVMGLIGKLHDEVILENIKKDNVPVLRRFSGGGTVVQGRGCLNFTLVLDKGRNNDLPDIRKSYAFILNKVITALKRCDIEAVLQPLSDLALHEGLRKFSGNAQHRGRKFIMHHGTILYDFDLALIEKYLCMPGKYPEYRQERGHGDFVTNIKGAPARIKDELCHEFLVSKENNTVSQQEESILKELSSQSRHRVLI
ncbi:MAG: lipoate--protein ligase family protein [Candidatus Omnitrophica bacterium]|nr:lipoate--protein ligase family protein [Candidatus Omnitrophota bacterium]